MAHAGYAFRDAESSVLIFARDALEKTDIRRDYR
jgi:hypothetical protein